MDIWIFETFQKKRKNVFHKISHLLVTCSSSLAMVDPHLVAVSGTGRASCTKQKNVACFVIHICISVFIVYISQPR